MNRLSSMSMRNGILIAALVWVLPSVAQAYLNYTVTNGTVTITGCSGLTGQLTIPDTIAGLPVTSIGFHAFYNYTGLTTIRIPNSVTSIGNSAFERCSVRNITIGNGVTNIGNYAFQFCHSLTSVMVPNSVTSIGSYAFYHCTNMPNVTIGTGVTTIGNNAFGRCYSLKGVFF